MTEFFEFFKLTSATGNDWLTTLGEGYIGLLLLLCIQVLVTIIATIISWDNEETYQNTSWIRGVLTGPSWWVFIVSLLSNIGSVFLISIISMQFNPPNLMILSWILLNIGLAIHYCRDSAVTLTDAFVRLGSNIHNSHVKLKEYKEKYETIRGISYKN